VTRSGHFTPVFKEACLLASVSDVSDRVLRPGRVCREPQAMRRHAVWASSGEIGSFLVSRGAVLIPSSAVLCCLLAC
jgi:hypothetical protein